MFALKQIIADKLYALRTPDRSDAFHDCFENWQDPSYLHEFFKKNAHCLEFYKVDRKTAVRQVLSESNKFFSDILDLINHSAHDSPLDETIFVPLHDADDFDLPLIETKAYGTVSRKCYLRLYAIRLSDGCYIVTGGLIKTTRVLQDCEEGKRILNTLKDVAKFLRKSNIEDAFDIGILIV